MRFTFLLLLIATGLHSNAQFKNQNAILAKYNSGSYTVYRNDQGKLDKVNKVWPIVITKASGKDANGNDLIESVLVKRAGVVDENFVPDLKEQPGYFSYDANKLIFFNEYAAYYKQTSNSDGLVIYDVLYEFIPEGGSSKSLKTAAEDIAAYRTATLNSQSTTRTVIAQNKEANETKERWATVYLIGREIGKDRTVNIHCHLDKEDKDLLPGMFLTAFIEQGQTNVTAVPNESLVEFEGKNYIFIQRKSNHKDEYMFECTEVKKGNSEYNYTAITLPEGRDWKTLNIVTNGAYDILSKLKNREEEGGHAH